MRVGSAGGVHGWESVPSTSDWAASQRDDMSQDTLLNASSGRVLAAERVDHLFLGAGRQGPGHQNRRRGGSAGRPDMWLERHSRVRSSRTTATSPTADLRLSGARAYTRPLFVSPHLAPAPAALHPYHPVRHRTSPCSTASLRRSMFDRTLYEREGKVSRQRRQVVRVMEPRCGRWILPASPSTRREGSSAADRC